MGYDQSLESDILLLDISDNENYIWTDYFDPSPPVVTETPPSSSAASSEPPNKSPTTLIGAVVGSVIGVALLSIGGFFLYKWNKNKQRRQEVMKIPGSDSKNQAEVNIYNRGDYN